MNLQELIKQEGWQIVKKEDKHVIHAFNQEFPITHPVLIHLKRYREETVPALKYFHMKSAHDYLWPEDIETYHDWTKKRFETHCEHWNFISWAGCASSAKSYDAAKVALIFWLANPKERAVMIASTTLLAMGRRVWGYTTKLLNSMAVKMPFQYLSGNAPQILYPYERGGTAKNTLCGIMAAAAKQGSDETAISGFIGTHPPDSMLLILDEATELSNAILNSVANLKSTEKPFQLIAIGNSSNVFDLHGSLSTPAASWSSVDPYRDTQWNTTHKNGTCLLFTGYNSPAIHETDPKKKKLLSSFLATEKSVKEAEETYGKNSIMFWRFTLGFWMPSTIAPTVFTKEFLDTLNIYNKAHWLGAEPLQIVGGLDIAFSAGGDQCLLQLGYLGQTVNGDMVLDFRGNDLLFKIHISPKAGKAIELQISEQVQKILNQYGCPLSHVAIDATGQGRAIGGNLQLQMNEPRSPIKILTTRTGGESKNSFDVILKTRHELWFDYRRFLEQGNIKGVNAIAAAQFTNRLVIQNPKTNKQELETKKEYKDRMRGIMPALAHSPDEADVETLCLQSAIINFGFHPGQKREVPQMAVGHMEEIAAWKSRVHMVQQEHMEPRREYPKAEFKGGLEGLKPFGSF